MQTEIGTEAERNGGAPIADAAMERPAVTAGRGRDRELAARTPVELVGVPFDVISTAETIEAVAAMIGSGRPHYLATANVDFTVQARADVELRRILADADLVLCDGMPLVWASRLLGNPLPERVAGSDLVPQLLHEAAQRGWRVFFLGGTPDSVRRAEENVRARHPGLALVGAWSPPFQPLLEMDHAGIIERVRAARPDILLVAFGCPKQEKWINMHFRQLGVPVNIGVGATLDFLAGSVARAPRWMQRSGLEWIFRLVQEPRRLFRRYLTDLRVFSFAILRQAWHFRRARGNPAGTIRIEIAPAPADGIRVVRIEGSLHATTVGTLARVWPRLLAERRPLVLDLSGVDGIDSTGLGLLTRLQKHWRRLGLELVLVAPGNTVRQALAVSGGDRASALAADVDTAVRSIHAGQQARRQPVSDAGRNGGAGLDWEGEIQAANADTVWRLTLAHLESLKPGLDPAVIRLGRVRFMDSTGVGIMVRARKWAVARGLHLTFADPSPAVRNVLRILRLEHTLIP